MLLLEFNWYFNCPLQ